MMGTGHVAMSQREADPVDGDDSETVAAPEPMAISESMFGAPENRVLNPLVKQAALTAMTGIVSRNCVKAKTSAFSGPGKKAGRGSPAIWPMLI